MANELAKEIKKNWMVLTFVVVQAIFVVGVKSQQIDSMQTEINTYKAKQEADHEVLIEVRNDVKWLRRYVEGD